MMADDVKLLRRLSSGSSRMGRSNSKLISQQRCRQLTGMTIIAAFMLFLISLLRCLASPSLCWPLFSSGSSTTLGSQPFTSSSSQDRRIVSNLGGAALLDPFNRSLPELLVRTLKEPWRKQHIPVVQFYQRPGQLPCNPKHYIYNNLKQARKLNSVVYFIGPEECADMARDLDVTLDPYTSYQDVVDWFQENIGYPVGYQVRWFVLHAFMERHAIPRLFYSDSDVLLFANVTELAELLFQRMHLVLSVRWPSLRSLGPSQYASTAVSGHVSLWTYDALTDFLKFFTIFMQEAVLFGERGDKQLVEHKAYNDMIPLGWYTHRVCWMKRPEELHPQCISDTASGVTPERSARLRGKFSPRYRVESFCMPRWCNSTKWSDEGWCVFDNNFSIQTPMQFFKYRPEDGMKLPTSMHYTYFEDWSKDFRKQTFPVQFLGIHFQAHKKGYITRGDVPSTTWGSSND